MRTCTWGKSDSSEPASGKLWQQARHQIGKRGRGTAVDLSGCPDTRGQNLGCAYLGRACRLGTQPQGITHRRTRAEERELPKGSMQ